MHSEPLVSIIIPTFNRAHLIGETLDSVLAQTYTNWECIVVDDGSTDDTDAVVNAYVNKDPRFKYYRRPPEHLPGGNGARNFGFKMSKGKFVIFLDSDDLFINTTVKKRVENALLYQCDMLINNSVAFKNEIGDLDVVWNIMGIKNNNLDLIVRFLNIDMPWCTNSVTWKSNFFKKCGGWDESINAWQDWELHCRILFHNPKLKYIPYSYDNYFRNASHLKIGNSYKGKDYFLSLQKVIDNIEYLIRLDVEIRNNKEITHALKLLILKIFIKFPIKYGYFTLPLRFFLKNHLLKYISVYEFSKCYLLEGMGKSYKLRNFVIQKSYYNHQKKLSNDGMHLKFRIANLKSE